MYLKCIVIVATFFLTCSTQSLTPVWPRMWHSWVKVTITDARINDTDKRVFDYGQRVAYDTDNQYTCRYFQINSLNETKVRPADICDYKQGKHWSINDTMAESKCNDISTINGPLGPISWPKEFIDQAKYMNRSDRINNLDCDMFHGEMDVNGVRVAMTVWVTIDENYPCQISLVEIGSPIVYTWAFDGFTSYMPPEAYQCTAPTIMCSMPDWTCNAIPDLDPDQLGMALQWICDTPNTKIDCNPINPGGEYFTPNDVVSHSNWAFNKYYMLHRARFGLQACSFNGIPGRLVPPKKPVPVQPVQPMKKKRQADSDFDDSPVFSRTLVCPSLTDYSIAGARDLWKSIVSK